MPPFHRALLFLSIIGGLMLALLVGFIFFRSLMPATDASLSRMPDIIQEAWRKRARTDGEAKKQALAASRECVANGDRYCLMENYSAALREYTKAVDLDGTNLQACLEAGRVAWHMKNLQAARKAWQKAVELNPLAAAAHGGLFDLCRAGNSKDQRRAFLHAITLRTLSPHRTVTREFILLNPEIAREIELVASGAPEPMTETDQRKLLTKAWQALPKHDTRTADICFARVLSLQQAAETKGQ